jgi:hypothetical protein
MPEHGRFKEIKRGIHSVADLSVCGVRFAIDRSDSPCGVGIDQVAVVGMIVGVHQKAGIGFIKTMVGLHAPQVNAAQGIGIKNPKGLVA